MVTTSRIDPILAEIAKLSVEEKRLLLDRIHDDLEVSDPEPPLTDAMKRLLDERIAELDANPHDTIPADVVIAELRARFCGDR